MELEFPSPKKMIFNRIASHLDQLVLDFTSALSTIKISHVVVSGYVSILFGRSRSTEDVDILIKKITPKKFQQLWNKLKEDFVCLNASNPEKAYNYLTSGTAVRFSRKNKFIPNIEVKFAKDGFDEYSMKNSIEIRLNNKFFKISPLELQVAYKLFLGSEKDIEDARFLYKLFKEKISNPLLQKFIKQLNIPPAKARKYLGALK